MSVEHVEWRRGSVRSDEYEAARRGFLLGRMVYRRRAELGLSRAESAVRIRMSQSRVSRLEGGAMTPEIPLLERLAEALDVDLTCEFTPRAAAAMRGRVGDGRGRRPARHGPSGSSGGG